VTDFTRVNFAAMKQAEASFRKALAEYNAALDDLHGKVRSTLAEWDGDAKRAYEVKQKEWTVAGRQLGVAVNSMGGALGESHDSYRTTENRNAGLFGG
jgi:early secretory antigenic target protein ESAT-6